MGIYYNRFWDLLGIHWQCIVLYAAPGGVNPSLGSVVFCLFRNRPNRWPPTFLQRAVSLGLANASRDCHGFEKPAGKCHGLTWGAGTGWVYPTLTQPVPAAMGWWVTQRIQTPLEDLINHLQAHQLLLPTFIATHCIMSEARKHNKKVSQRTQLLIS